MDSITILTNDDAKKEKPMATPKDIARKKPESCAADGAQQTPAGETYSHAEQMRTKKKDAADKWQVGPKPSLPPIGGEK
jgi:hypothetical protein